MAIALTNKRKAWVKQFKPTKALRGTPLHYNHMAAARFNQRLQSLVRQMTEETERQIRLLFESDHAEYHFAQDDSTGAQARILSNALQKKFKQLFNSRSKGLADYMVNQQDKASKSSLHASLKELSGGLSIKTDILTDRLSNVMIASTAESVGLIRSIPQEYLGKVQGALMRSIATGRGLQDLMPKIKKISGQTDRRVQLMALDQNRKVFNAINKERMQASGIKKAEWLHSGGSNEPRKSHVAMDGKIFDLKKGMWDPDVKEWIQPGLLPYCRCTMRPVIEFEDGEEF